LVIFGQKKIKKKSEKSKEKHFGWAIFLVVTRDWRVGHNCTVSMFSLYILIQVDKRFGSVTVEIPLVHWMAQPWWYHITSIILMSSTILGGGF
jgi:hypothetical protein